MGTCTEQLQMCYLLGNRNKVDGILYVDCWWMCIAIKQITADREKNLAETTFLELHDYVSNY